MTDELPRSGASVPPELLWTPSPARVERSNLTRYRRWLASTRGLDFGDYHALWRWSVADLDAFWRSVWEFFHVREGPAPAPAIADRRMPGTRWFPGARLNYAELALRRRDDHPAIISGSENAQVRATSYAELARSVAAAAAGLRRLGVEQGDRVVAYLPNVPETVVALLASASIGAVWSSCAPEFGVSSVVDRFRQIEPRLLLAVEGYRYGGRWHDRREALDAIRAQLPTLEATVLVPAPGQEAAPATPAAGTAAAAAGVFGWAELLGAGADRAEEPLDFVQVPFDHPLWILYSSGTTGLPKPIVQGHGGIVLEHLKSLALHLDLGPSDRFSWFTTTGWMMWNFLVSGLLLGASVLCYDGSPGYPDMGALWRFAEATGMTYFGTSAAYVLACMKAGVEPARIADLSALHSIGSTGSPLPPEGFAWLYQHVGEDILVGSVSGGTDVCTAFVESCPWLPVHAGEIQCRGLGAKVEAFDEQGRSVLEEVGELVITEPLPSMPLYFWNDPDGSRYRDSYFSTWPGVWRHGDWVEVTRRGSVVISGRSDSTLNRGGVRMGTSEFYRVVEGLDEITDSLVVDVSDPGGEGRLLLFVVLRPGLELDGELERRVRDAVRRQLSPRHVPDEVHAIAAVPRTLSGKKLEVPVKRILTGVPLERAVSKGALANPDAIYAVVALATKER
ncbi:MAG TPA: acetoacetate--CoA ligase [Actinomycetota bacterium]|nr:acetoacetate--CoA ligase [Actinomycetota bacterium]